ncbi:MAG: glutamate synthase subunit beta [Deltaproteobacteria bacterium]|nr:glutamate synthase subunit beta [Deltaproteobacteria bacterium]
MSDPKGFIAIRRQDPKRRSVRRRIKDYRELYEPLHPEVIRSQGARCMDCGIPFCQSDYGCPVQNLIPNFNDMVHRRHWRDALKTLQHTNNFPEFTGRLCPAPCETACVLGITDEAVTIREIERNIVERGFARGWVRAIMPVQESGFKVAVVGSGPAGLAAAQQLRRAGHQVTVFEKADRIGGLLRYGIPDFKMEKRVLDRRLEQMRIEGVRFSTGVRVGEDLPAGELMERFDAVCLAMGSEAPRELDVKGRNLAGIHQAMSFLEQQNRVNAGDLIEDGDRITAEGRNVLVIGGGDTGSDCVGTCHRQGARNVTQFEILPRPPDKRDPATPWPQWPRVLRHTHAHEEGCDREWGVMTTGFTGLGGFVRRAEAVRVEWPQGTSGGPVKVRGSKFDIDVDMVLLAMGFTGPRKNGLIKDLGVSLDERGNVAVDSGHQTSVEGVFAAGDVRRGASLVVWAIREGRDAADGIDRWLRSPD